jgi:agmatinase
MSYRTLEEEIKVLEQGLPPVEGDGFIGGRLDPQRS